jgi:hypothetical protein
MVTGAQKQQTEFLPDVEANAWSAQLYLVSRGHLMGLPMLRWLYFLMVVAALLWVAFGLPGGWLVGVLLLGAAALLAVTVRLMQRRAFISFAARPAPVTMTVLMPPTQKRPLYVTGILSVEQKVRSFTALPGFYRSFATREHALLCRVRERRIWRIGAWPEEEIGLWYAFFKPQEIDAVQPGDVRIGRSTLPGIAVTYRPSAPIRPERRRTPMQTTLYLAFVTEADRAAVLADLLVEWQPTAVKE